MTTAPDWQKCQANFLKQLEARSGMTNTRRAYEADMRDYTRVTGAPVWEATAESAEAFTAALAARGAAPATVNRKLAALASFLTYAQEHGLWPGENPFAHPDLRDHRQRPQVDFPTSTQICALLAQIDTDTPVGLRNLALLAGLIATTRRINEWLPLQWSDIREGQWFTYRCKGGDTKQQAMPPAIWRVIMAYIEAAGRGPLQPYDYLFVALSAAGERLRHTANGGHLHPGYIYRMVGRYGRQAGIPERCLRPHALRHAGAELRREAGAGPLDLQQILGHDNIQTTLSYLRRLDRPVDPYADSILAVLPVAYRQAR